MNTDIIKSQIRLSAENKMKMLADDALLEKVASIAEIITDAYRKGHKTLWAGNGGSAADAQHMVGELVNKFCMDRPGLPAMALTVDSSVMTSIGNDFSFDEVFARQIQACACEGDVFVGISTSGNSKNLVKALAECRKKGVITVALVGEKPCLMDGYDFVVHIPSTETPRIQECQTLIGHIICYIVEQNLFGKA